MRGAKLRIGTRGVPATRSRGLFLKLRQDRIEAATPRDRLHIGNLIERFQTRFQSIRLQPPANEVLAQFVARRWSAPIRITRKIAEGANGNVRAAMGDLEVWMG